MTYTIGIDLGGTNVRTALVDKTGNIYTEIIRATDAEKGPAHVINKIKSMIYSLLEKKPASAIGIGSPGPLDPKTGIILSPPNLPGWNAVPLTAEIQQEFQLPVFLDNDANAAALAETMLGAGKGYESVFYITISTGVGGGFVLRNQVVQGCNGYAGEIGNMIILPDGPSHPSLNAGCLEVLASGTAIAQRGRKLLGIQGDAGEVFKLMKEGNSKAKSIVEETINYLAIGIANIIHMVNPDIIVLGGGVMKSQEVVLPLLEAKVKTYVYPQLSEFIKLLPASLGTKAGVIGAALLPRSISC